MKKLQTDFLNALDEFGYDIFDLKQIRATNYFSDKEITQALRSLTNSGLLVKLEQGKYIKNSFSDEFVIGSFLAKDGGIAYWSALNTHGLTEQFPNVVYVQTAKRSGSFIHNNLRYKFVKVNSRKINGYETHGYGNHTFKMTNVEKTLVDCFDLPHHAGWYQEIIKALYQAKINFRKLVKYCKANGNNSVTKRLGFLCELLQKENSDYFIRYAQSILGDEYSLFEIDGLKTGKYNRRWRLIINMPENEIIEIAKS
jgi:predicted transcriptional regulator of viral defense system